MACTRACRNGIIFWRSTIPDVARSPPRRVATSGLSEKATKSGALCGKALLAAKAHLDAGEVGGADRAFYEGKIVNARFFGEQILPATSGLAVTVMAGSADLFAVDL